MEWGLPFDVVGRVLIAAVLGIVVGFEREQDGHPAGTRTIAMVAVGAALFGAISTRGFDEFIVGRSDTNVQVDVTRVASEVVVGIGFLGAGVIFRRGGSIQNLTTAATMWATAAIGLAAGVGNVGLASAVALLVLVLLVVVPVPERWVLERWVPQRRSVHVRLAPGASADELRRRVDQLAGAEVIGWRVEKHDGCGQVELVLRARRDGAIDAAITSLVGSELVDDLRAAR
jgi:putative Mg2+ transporter-C (MgtC) family protein